MTYDKRDKKANVVKTTLLTQADKMMIIKTCFYDEFAERSVVKIMITGPWLSACGQSAAQDSEWWQHWERFLG